jgi:hypothetical protein
VFIPLVDVSDIDSLFSEFAGQRSRRAAYTKSKKDKTAAPKKVAVLFFYIK